MKTGIGLVTVLFVSLVGMGAGFVQQIVLAKYLGDVNYGVYAYAISLVSFATILSVGGVATGVKKYLPYYQSQNDSVSIGCYFVVSTLFSVVMLTALYVVYASFQSKQSKNGVLLEPGLYLALLLVASCLTYYLCELLRSMQRGVLASFLESATISVGVLVAVLTIGSKFILDVQSILSIRFILLAGICVYILWVIRGNLSLQYTIQPKSYPIAEWLSPLLHLQGIAVMGILKAQFDLLILALFVGPAEIGVYAITKRLAGLVGMPSVASSMFVVPRVVKTGYSVGKSNFQTQNILWINSFITCFICLAILFGITFWSHHIATFLDFDVDLFFIILVILALGNVIIVLGGPCVGLLTLQGAERWVARTTVVCVFFGMFMTLALGYFWAEIGVAVGSSIGQAIFISVCAHQYKKVTGNDTTIWCLLSGGGGKHSRPGY